MSQKQPLTLDSMAHHVGNILVGQLNELRKFGASESSLSLQEMKERLLIIEYLDLASLNSVRNFVQRFTTAHSRLDFLINNAGLLCDTYTLTEDNLEQTLGVNHLGPFLLTELLLPVLKQSGPARIILVSSAVHSWGNLNKPDFQLTKDNYGMMKAYSQSKLANLVYAKELSRRLEGTQLTVVSLHPGAVQTEITKNIKSGLNKFVTSMIRPFMINPWTGAQTTLYTVLCPKLESGGYYSNCALKQPSQIIFNEENQKWLLQKCYELVGLTEQQ